MSKADDEFGFVDKVGRGKGTKKPGPAGLKPVSPDKVLDGFADSPNTSTSTPNHLDVDIMLKHTRTGSNASSRSRSPVPGLGNSSPRGSQSSSGEPDTPTLPQLFVVKYLGFRETTNLWGIKYTRRPVDEMVTDAKRVLSTSTDKPLALLKLEVTEEGILVGPMPQNTNPTFPNGKFAIESISYGVQDLVYTRVFAMIVVRQEGSSAKLSELSKQAGGTTGLPFRCHAFVTDTRETARNLTYALAAAFQKFSQKVAAGKIKVPKPQRFAIDLRSPEDIEAELIDSEA